MEKWEYKIFKHVMSYTTHSAFEGTLVEDKTTQAQLNKLGQEGWELVSTNIYDKPEDERGFSPDPQILHYLKRKIS